VDPKAQHLSKWNVGDTHLYPYAVIIDEYVKSGYLAVSWHIHICIYILTYRHRNWMIKETKTTNAPCHMLLRSLGIPTATGPW
jgi:hypothetical protein